MAKRKEWFDVPRIVMAVADVDAFLVFHDAILAGKVTVRWVIFEPFGERLGQFAGRVDVAEEDAGNRGAPFLTGLVRLDDGGNLIKPRHRDGCAADDDDDGFRIGCGNGPN